MMRSAHLAHVAVAGLIAAVAIIALLTDGIARDARDNGLIDVALRLRPAWSSTLSAAASRDMETNRTTRATLEARAALARNPIDVVALRVLGLSRMQAHDPIGATAIMTLSGRLSWRDDGTQLWLLSAAMSQRDYVAAVQHVDALLRLQDEVPLAIQALLVLSNDPAAQDAIAERLAGDPPWRDYYIFSLARAPRVSPSEVSAILIKAQRLGAILPEADLNELFSRFRADGDAASAQSLRRSLYGHADD
jgi:hypothetical protein